MIRDHLNYTANSTTLTDTIFRQRGVGIFDVPDQRAGVRDALGYDVAILGQMSAQSVDALRALMHQQVPRRNTTALACCASLLTGTNRMLGRVAASQIASASAASFFCRFT